MWMANVALPFYELFEGTKEGRMDVSRGQVNEQTGCFLRSHQPLAMIWKQEEKARERSSVDNEKLTHNVGKKLPLLS